MKGINKHHLTPKKRGGGMEPSNILNFNIERHNNWHVIFGNKTLEEVINLLVRLRKMKGRN